MGLHDAYGPQLDLQALFMAVFLTPEFLQSKGKLVKQPLESVVGGLRALGVQPDQRHLTVLKDLGQVPFSPPNVGGWPHDDGWLSTAAAYTRLQFAQTTARHGDISAVEDAGVGYPSPDRSHSKSMSIWQTASPGSPQPTGCVRSMRPRLSARSAATQTRCSGRPRWPGLAFSEPAGHPVAG